MANGDKKKIKGKDRFVSTKSTVKKTSSKPTYKATTTKKVVIKPKAKVTMGKKTPATKYNIVIKSGGKTRRLPTRLATGAKAKKLVAAGRRKRG